MNNELDHNDILKVIQISDTHLFSDDNQTLFGTFNNKKFKELVNHLSQHELHDTDLIFLTGDLSQDETTLSYDKIVKLLDPLNIPIYWIPGNHDDLKNIETAFKKSNNFFSSRKLTTRHWHFIFLNTKLDGTAEGLLSDNELQNLKQEIKNIPDTKHIAIVMHHHPMKVNTPLIDQYILRNNKEFWDIVADTQVKLVICGHVHGDYQFKHNEINVETSPAGCFQLPKQCIELEIENKIGYKVYQLDARGFSAKATLLGD